VDQFCPRGLVAVALTRNGKDFGFQPENENAVMLGHVGRALYDYFKPS
jgi:hypothetical protein